MSAQRLYALHCGGETTDFATVDPFHPMIGTKADFPYFFYLVQHEDGNVSFDTGAHVSLIDDVARVSAMRPRTSPSRWSRGTTS